MTKLKRSYREVSSGLAGPRTWQILLDGKPVRTPAGAILSLPSAALADAVAEEWRVQGVEIRPTLMPLTRLSNTALDRVEPDRRAAIDALLSFASHDLLCFRAPGPAALVERQSSVWDPLLDWVNERYGVRFKTVSGIAPLQQSEDDLNVCGSFISRCDAFALTGIVSAANILGSAVLAVAMAEGRIDPAEAFATAELDATYQAEIWGNDPQTLARNQEKISELRIIQRLITLAAAV